VETPDTTEDPEFDLVGSQDPPVENQGGMMGEDGNLNAQTI
jgi:hypothetical protein